MISFICPEYQIDSIAHTTPIVCLEHLLTSSCQTSFPCHIKGSLDRSRETSLEKSSSSWCWLPKVSEGTWSPAARAPPEAVQWSTSGSCAQHSMTCSAEWLQSCSHSISHIMKTGTVDFTASKVPVHHRPGPPLVFVPVTLHIQCSLAILGFTFGWSCSTSRCLLVAKFT